MITKLKLENFRSFRNFTLEGLKPVTLIAGTNNVGKSTVLEALFLFMDRVSSDVFIKINSSMRGITRLSLSPAAVWEHFFTDFNTGEAIVISLENSGEMQSIAIRRDDSFSASSTIKSPLPNNSANAETYIHNSYPLKFRYTAPGREETSRFVLMNTGIALSFDQPPEHTPLIEYIGPNLVVPPNKSAEWFSKIELDGQSGKCVEILQMLEKRIRDLSVGITADGGSSLYADIGLPKRIPVNMLGGGTNRLMQIAFTMIAYPNSILLIDEIENGFHYSFFPKLWEIIGKTAKETSCQVFATTHSYECIRGAAAFADNDANSEAFRFIRLEKQGDGIVPQVFENDSLEYAVKNDWEVR